MYSHCADSDQSLVTTVQPSGRWGDVAGAGVEHGLDGEDHAGLEHEAFAAAAVVQHVGFVVVDAADAVAAELAHDAEALALRDRLDGVAHVARHGIAPHLGNFGCRSYPPGHSFAKS